MTLYSSVTPCLTLVSKMGKWNSTFHVFVFYFSYSAATWIYSGSMFYSLTCWILPFTTNSLIWKVRFHVPKYVLDSKFGITLRWSRTVCHAVFSKSQTGYYKLLWVYVVEIWERVLTGINKSRIYCARPCKALKVNNSILSSIAWKPLKIFNHIFNVTPDSNCQQNLAHKVTCIRVSCR